MDHDDDIETENEGVLYLLLYLYVKKATSTLDQYDAAFYPQTRRSLKLDGC